MSSQDRKDEFRIEWDLHELGPKLPAAKPAAAAAPRTTGTRAAPQRRRIKAAAEEVA
jgi:hypothetical protein